MAFLLCQSVGNACSGLCNGLSQICVFPCRLCSETCRLGCQGVTQMFTSPFFPYLAVTCGLNLPPTVWALKSLVASCNSRWLTVNGCLTFIHILSAFYIVHRIYQTDDETNPAKPASATIADPEKGNKTSEPTSSYQRVVETTTVSNDSFSFFAVRSVASTKSGPAGGTFSRMSQVMLYDVGVALYIIVFFFWMGWQSYGVAHVLGGGAYENGEVCDHVDKWSSHSLALGFVYLMIVASSFCCSFLCLRPF